VEKQLQNVVETLSEVGRSDALTAKLRQLEQEKVRVKAQLAADAPVRMVPNVEKVIRDRIKMLEDLPRDPMTDAALTEKARMAVKAVLGNVTVIEDGEHVVAE